MAGYPSNLAKKFPPTEQFPQHILPLLPLYNAQWWRYESLTAIVLVYIEIVGYRFYKMWYLINYKCFCISTSHISASIFEVSYQVWSLKLAGWKSKAPFLLQHFCQCLVAVFNKSPRTCILCCHISPVQISGVVFTVDIIASLKTFFTLKV